MNCPHCQHSFDDDFNFCPSCEQQVKCLSCGRIVTSGKSKCLYCGVSFGSGHQSQQAINTFSLEETIAGNNRSRKVQLSFTDNAINNAAPLLRTYAPFSRAFHATESGNPLLTSENSSVDTTLDEAEYIDQDPTTSTQDSPSQTEASSDLPRAKDYFEIDAKGFLVPGVSDYKGTTKQLQQQRFCLLYTEAYLQHMNVPVPNRTHLASAAKKANKIYDSNFPNYLTKLIGQYFINTDGQLKLNRNGQIQLAKIIEEMQDDELVGYQYWERGNKTAGKRARVSKAEITEVDRWLLMPSELDKFDIRKLKKPLDWCLFAVHDITKEIQAAEAVKPGVAYAYLTRRHKKVSIEKDSFTSVFNRKYNKKYLGRSADGLYFLTTDGEAQIGELLSGTAAATVGESDSNSN